jgi:hypothetical protein
VASNSQSRDCGSVRDSRVDSLKGPLVDTGSVQEALAGAQRWFQVWESEDGL